MAETYKRAVFTGPKQIRIDELPIPTPGPRQALVKVKACAICTWEQRMYTGEEHFYPLAGGHEVSGELVEVGSQVFSDAKIGDRVIFAGLTRCGYCDSCRKGLDSNCDNSRKPLRDVDVAGPAGLGEYVLIEDYQLYKAANDVSFEELCLVEPVSCVTRSIRQAKLERTDNVVVVGAGIMGLLHVLLAKQAGARVIVSEPNAKRAAFAKTLGADEIVDPVNESFLDRIKDLTSGKGADVIFNAVSIAAAVEQSVEAAAKRGRIMVYASIHPRGTKISVDPNLFHGKEIVLSGTVSQDKEDFLIATRMVSEKLIDLKPFISKVLPFAQLEEAILAALTPETYRSIVTM
jgi:threonine dehydrogenase-like Zn-dependent dehydrogenase